MSTRVYGLIEQACAESPGRAPLGALTAVSAWGLEKWAPARNTGDKCEKGRNGAKNPAPASNHHTLSTNRSEAPQTVPADSCA